MVAIHYSFLLFGFPKLGHINDVNSSGWISCKEQLRCCQANAFNTVYRGGSRVWKEGGHLAEKQLKTKKKKKKKGHNNNS